MSKTVFDQLMEKLDEVILGRRYIIAEIGKLKEIVGDIQDTSSGDAMTQIGGAVNEMKTFMQNSINTLTDLKNNINNLGNSINSLNNTVETTLNAINALKAGGGAVSAAPISSPAPSAVRPMTAAPVATSAPAPAAAPTGAAGASFDAILNAVNAKSPAVDLGNLIDGIRTKLSKENPLNPILFELSMESGRLKALGANPLNDKNLQTLVEKINKWKAS